MFVPWNVSEVKSHLLSEIKEIEWRKQSFVPKIQPPPIPAKARYPKQEAKSSTFIDQWMKRYCDRRGRSFGEQQYSLT